MVVFGTLEPLREHDKFSVPPQLLGRAGKCSVCVGTQTEPRSQQKRILRGLRYSYNRQVVDSLRKGHGLSTENWCDTTRLGQWKQVLLGSLKGHAYKTTIYRDQSSLGSEFTQCLPHQLILELFVPGNVIHAAHIITEG